MEKKTRRRYTSEEKREAVAFAKRLGVRPAGAALGIPHGSIANWLKQPSKPVEAAPPLTKKAPTKRVAKHYTPSQREQILECALAKGVTAAAAEHGVSRYSIYDWRRKVKRAAAGEGDSPTSGPDPKDIEARRDREILDMWELHRGLGPSQICNQLRRGGVKVSTNTVRRVMEDAGYRPPKRKEPSKHTRRYEAIRPNRIWHLDYLQRYINRASTFSLILIDDHSRFVVGHGVDDAERADFVIATFEAAVERHGKPEMIVHDKGSAFWAWRGISRFTKLLEEMDIEQIPGTKENNGKLEVFNANIQKELFDVHRFYDLAEMKRRLATHLRWYNLRRTSHALGGLLVPADRYYGRVEEVLARIEAGVVDDSDPLDLKNRVLELFKVISVGGRAEVWLMGQRILQTG